jgi:hypothetical protein
MGRRAASEGFDVLVVMSRRASVHVDCGGNVVVDSFGLSGEVLSWLSELNGGRKAEYNSLRLLYLISISQKSAG